MKKGDKVRAKFGTFSDRDAKRLGLDKYAGKSGVIESVDSGILTVRFEDGKRIDFLEKDDLELVSAPPEKESNAFEDAYAGNSAEIVIALASLALALPTRNAFYTAVESLDVSRLVTEEILDVVESIEEFARLDYGPEKTGDELYPFLRIEAKAFLKRRLTAASENVRNAARREKEKENK